MKSFSEELQEYLTSLNYVNLYNSKPNILFYDYLVLMVSSHRAYAAPGTGPI